MPELSEHSKRFLETLVESGCFTDQDAAMEQAIQLLEQELQYRQLANRPSDLSYEEWSRRFRNWVESHPPIGHFVDDSRDSIYSGTIDDPR
jgi:Arc/MetJ-type ribon-helix-helix transcriptional regulator